MRSKALWLVFAGGTLGTLLRAFATSFGADMLNTMLINVVGCAVLGLVQHASWFDSELKQAFFSTGFCGGFTTLSGIAVFTVVGPLDPIVKLEYAVGSFLLGLLAYWLWAVLGKSFKPVTL